MHIYLQNIAAGKKSPRFYHLMLQKDLLEGWTLIREWGAQGSPGRVRCDHHLTREDAISALINVRDAQIRRGFQVVFSQGEEYQRDYE
jgi:predicted DNA-binding WGR domain protein